MISISNIRWPVEETGINSVKPSIMPKKPACKIVIMSIAWLIIEKHPYVNKKKEFRIENQPSFYNSLIEGGGGAKGASLLAVPFVLVKEVGGFPASFLSEGGGGAAGD